MVKPSSNGLDQGRRLSLVYTMRIIVDMPTESLMPCRAYALLCAFSLYHRDLSSVAVSSTSSHTCNTAASV